MPNYSGMLGMNEKVANLVRTGKMEVCLPFFEPRDMSQNIVRQARDINALKEID